MSSLNVDQNSSAKKRRSIAKQELINVGELINIDSFVSKGISDDVTILRLAYNYVQMKHCLRNSSSVNLFKSTFLQQQYLNIPPMMISQKSSISVEEKFFKTHNMAFFIMLSISGDVIFASNRIQDITGIPLNEFIGENIFDYIHPVDSMELSQLLKPSAIGSLSEPKLKYTIKIKDEESSDNPCETHHDLLSQYDFTYVNMNLRFKHCTVKNKKFYKFTSSVFSTMNLIGKIVKVGDGLKPSNHFSGFIIPLFTPSLQIFTLMPTAYVSQHKLDLSFLWCSDSLSGFFHGQDKDFTPKSLYTCVNFSDLLKVKTFHTEVLQKCHVISSTIRLRSNNGNFVVCKLRGHLIFNVDKQPQHIVCVYFPLRIYNDENLTSNESAAVNVIPNPAACNYRSFPSDFYDKNLYYNSTYNNNYVANNTSSTEDHVSVFSNCFQAGINNSGPYGRISSSSSSTNVTNSPATHYKGEYHENPHQFVWNLS